jgi:hypothetical protein
VPGRFGQYRATEQSWAETILKLPGNHWPSRFTIGDCLPVKEMFFPASSADGPRARCACLAWASRIPVMDLGRLTAVWPSPWQGVLTILPGLVSLPVPARRIGWRGLRGLV